jgi:predicted GIY-YIG superfamily endonuclease
MPSPAAILRQCFGIAMHYTYILWSSKSSNFYFGSTSNLEKRLEEHNKGLSKSTAPYAPWKLVWFAAFENRKLAEDFERYLKSGSGKAFAYKRFLDSEALKKDKFASNI